MTRWVASPPANDQIVSEIRARCGFVAPFFVPALETPEVLESLWQQTLSAYLDNPLPPAFKDRLFIALSRTCSLPYAAVCHNAVLRPLGISVSEALDLLEHGLPDARDGGKALVAALERSAPIVSWPDPDTESSGTLLRAASEVFLGSDRAGTCARELRRVLGSDHFPRLAQLLAYVRAYQAWVEMHPELSDRADELARKQLGSLLPAEPRLVEFFRDYREKLERQTGKRAARRRDPDEAEGPLRHLAAIVESSNDAIATYDLEGTILSWNSGACRMFGYEREEIVGQPIFVLVSDDRTREVVAALARVGEGWSTEAFETVRLRKDGSVVHVSLSISPIKDGTGRIRGALSIARDITQRMRAQDALQESQAQLAQAQRIAGLGSWEWDIRADRVSWSDELYRLYGLTRDQSPGSYEAYIDLVHPEDRDLVHRVLRQAFQDHQPFAFEHRLAPTGGEVRWHHCLGHLIADSNGQPARMVGTAQDITERKRAEQELRAMTLELERSNRALAGFAAVAAHDLQEPLRKIQFFTAHLEREVSGVLSEEMLDSVRRVQGAATRMQKLIQDLLNLARLSFKPESVVTVELGELAVGVLGDLELRIQELSASIELGPLPRIEADATQMYQLLQNLIGNALKFHRADRPPVIRIHGEHLDSESRPVPNESPEAALCRVTVEDEGIGFAPEESERIFAIFERLGGRSQYEGSGIGLAVCRKIAELHGGSIRAEGFPGQGARFVVTMPQRQKARTQAGTAVPSEVGGLRPAIRSEA